MNEINKVLTYSISSSSYETNEIKNRAFSIIPMQIRLVDVSIRIPEMKYFKCDNKYRRM